MSGYLLRIYTPGFRFTEFLIWSLWAYFLVQKTRSMLLAFTLWQEEVLPMEPRCDLTMQGPFFSFWKIVKSGQHSWICIVQYIVCCQMQEGKLRVLQYDGAHDLNHTRSNILSQENLVQVEQHFQVLLYISLYVSG